MAKTTTCPKCSSESIAKNFFYGSKFGSIVILILGLAVVVQDPTNLLGWIMIVAGVVAFPQKRFKCNACGTKWT